MMFEIAEVTPFTIVWRVLVVVAKVLESIMLDVDVIPLTIEVRVLEATLDILVVAEVNPDNEVVATTPLIVVVRILVEVANDDEFPVMTVEVATTPLMLEVKTFPVTL
jgi:hypothetical protein